MAEELKLHFRGDPVLSKQAKQVDNIDDPDFQKFLDELIEACFKYDGVGIAAPQVGVSLQVFVMASQPNPRYPDAPEMEPEVLINPVVITQAEEIEYGWEACLSVPGFRGWVPRPVHIEVEYINRKGQFIKKSLDHFSARLFLHENDHLLGTLYPDRMGPDDPLLSSEEFEKLMETQAKKSNDE